MLQLCSEELPDQGVQPGQGLPKRFSPSGGTQGSQELLHESRLMHKLSSSDPPVSKVPTASPEQDTNCEVSERRRGTLRASPARGELEPCSSPRPEPGDPQRGLHAAGTDERQNASTLGHPFPHPLLELGQS